MAKRLIVASFIMLLSVVSLHAQRIQVIDSDGTPVPFVTVTTSEGKYITSSDLDGWIEDVGKNTVIHLAQVAYKPLTIAVADIKNGKITLEEVNYDLPEVVVKPKPYLYAQTYFRDIYIDEEGPIYYRGGVIDNTYDLDKKEVKAKKRHLSKGSSGFLRFLIDRFCGPYDEFCQLPEKPYYERLLKARDEGRLTLTDDGTGRLIIADSICQLGYIYWDREAKLRTVSFDLDKYYYHHENAKNKVKAEKKGKTFEPDTLEQQRVSRTLYQVYRTDSLGNSTPDDFVMSQFTKVGRFKHSGNVFLLQAQSYATAYSYVNKKEYNQMRKDNKVEMNIQELRLFEKNNDIPPLAPNIKEQIDKLFVKELSK